MFSHYRGRGFTLVELIVVIIIIGFLIALLLPKICASRVTSRRIVCINNMKQVALALYNYHDAHKCFPGSNSLPFSPKPGESALPLLGIAHGGALDTSTPPDGRYDAGTGFSWQTLILPHIEENNLYKNLTTVPTTSNFGVNETSGPFAWYFATPTPGAKKPKGQQLIADKDGNVIQPPLCYPWYYPLCAFKCPSFGGDDWSVDNPDAVVGVKTPYTDDYKSALTNYVALGASHRKSLWGTNGSDPDFKFQGGRRHPNGVMYPGSRTSIDSIKDGTSNTFLICETREITRAAWYEGATAAVVGLAGDPTFKSASNNDDDPYGVPIGAETNLNRGNDGDESTWYDPGNYVKTPGATSDAASGWIHGPSSYHPGIVNHVLADGCVKCVSNDLDPTLYMHLITRAGYEPVDEFHDD